MRSNVARLPLYLTTLALLAGCSSESSRMQAASAMAPTVPAQIMFSERASPDANKVVGIHLEGENSFQSKHYGKVLGYIKGTTSMTSQVVMLSANLPVVFKNVDIVTHTASFLGDATRKSAPWPASFTGQEAASQAGTAIGTTNFSTGPLGSMKTSAVYNTGAPGFYMIGCFFHYVSQGMRTVIVVK